jgi:hypothetical protein
MNINILSVPKRVLFFAAAFVWGFAAYRILTLGFVDVLNNTKSYWINISIGLIGAYFFFKYVFYKMYLKHTKRIINSKFQQLCFFSFFDTKGYLIMTFMIIGGITLRKAHIIPSIYLGTFYMTLGVSLLLASISFMYSGIRYQIIKAKYYHRITV